MPNDARNVLVGKPKATGGILYGENLTLPTSESTTLAAGYKAVGYVAKDGVTKSENRDSDTIAAWGGDTIAVLQKSFSVQWKFKMAEFFSTSAAYAIYGTNATETAATSSATRKIAAKATAKTPPRLTWIFEMVYGDAITRIVVPSAQVTDVGDTTFKDDDIAVFDVTLTSFPDSSGVYYYVYGDTGVKA